MPQDATRVAPRSAPTSPVAAAPATAPKSPAALTPPPDEYPNTALVQVAPAQPPALPTNWRTGAHAGFYRIALSAVAVVALLAICGLGSYFIVQDERSGQDAQASTPEAAPTVVPRDISSREVDPAPLTVKEVFPAAQIKINPNEQPYQVLKTQATKDCKVAVDGKITTLLSDLGCSQVVRATLRNPTKAYLATTGVFNLDSAEGADWAYKQIKPMVDKEQGRFQGMVAGQGTESVSLSSAHVGWDIRGHYLVYAVIARADGKAFPDTDPYAKQMMYDLIELHLRQGVLEKRGTKPVGAGAAETQPAG
ncbi:hypothetical protein [Rhizomonospora bruguierae]|uniref:hypothetical protein n=1 Tax=Rhizomonospora bruguierae TaxID=1581705 RepID=UPI001BCE218C|nr:hypothetical protein [Micromonospora sp. NBRC 107566]